MKTTHMASCLDKRRNTINTEPEDQDILENSAYNPFPEPQTIPAGWDLSGLTFALQTDSDMDEEDSVES